jgi:hypothetical protein
MAPFYSKARALNQRAERAEGKLDRARLAAAMGGKAAAKAETAAAKR